MVIGTPGGSRIITVVMQTLMNVIDYGMTAQEAVDAPRFHHQWLPGPDLCLEPFALSPDTRRFSRAWAMRFGPHRGRPITWRRSSIGAPRSVATGRRQPASTASTIRAAIPAWRSVTERAVREAFPMRWTLFALVVLLAGAPPARAAGGHYAVDDAAILDPGSCQLEVWIDRAAGGRGTLLHAGPGCRLGPVELSLNLDHFNAEGVGAVTAIGPQLKWVRELAPALSAGIVLSAAVRDHAPNFIGSSVVVPLTWEVGESVRVHLNAGRDFLRDRPNLSRSGAAVEWLATPNWLLVAERFREVGLDFWRAGIRYVPQDGISIDLSRAEGLAGAPSRWALGLNLAFDR